MTAHAFDYSDYHRTIIGFHGTDELTADQLVAGENFKDSESDDDWFGKGIYFWEYAPKQAWWWARKFKKHDRPAVIGAIIRLGNCFDLLDPANVRTLTDFHTAALGKWPPDIPIPKNGRHHRDFDCAIFNLFYQEAAGSGKPIDSARAVYVPTSSAKRVWKGSWIYEEAHIQICVRNLKNILAVWHVRPNGRYGKQRHEEGAANG